MKTNKLLLLSTVLLLSACATQQTPMNTSELAGFFTGLWHGFIAVWALIGHLFDDSIRVYQIPNNGGWYDFGFCLGIGAFSGGCSRK